MGGKSAVWRARGCGPGRQIHDGRVLAEHEPVVRSTISLVIYVPLFFATSLHNDPDPGEAVILPAILIAVAAVVGTVGGMLGKGAYTALVQVR
jgi:hypothetical protein